MYAKMYALFCNYLFCKFNNGFTMVSFAPSYLKTLLKIIQPKDLVFKIVIMYTVLYTFIQQKHASKQHS